MSGMGLPLASTIHIAYIVQALIVLNPAEYRRNLLVAIVEPSLEIA
jgi:hypothetical protein